MDVISPPRFFSPLFSSRGQGCDFFLREGKDFSFVRAPRGDGKSICMIAASLSSCYAGRGGENKTEGLQYLEPKGNVLLGSPGQLLTLRRQPNTRKWKPQTPRPGCPACLSAPHLYSLRRGASITSTSITLCSTSTTPPAGRRMGCRLHLRIRHQKRTPKKTSNSAPTMRNTVKNRSSPATATTPSRAANTRPGPLRSHAGKFTAAEPRCTLNGTILPPEPTPRYSTLLSTTLPTALLFVTISRPLPGACAHTSNSASPEGRSKKAESEPGARSFACTTPFNLT